MGSGPLWGTETDDLNATLLARPPGGGTDEHVNDERDVLVVVLAGSATVTLDGEPHGVGAGRALVVEKGPAPPHRRRPGGRALPLRPPAARRPSITTRPSSPPTW